MALCTFLRTCAVAAKWASHGASRASSCTRWTPSMVKQVWHKSPLKRGKKGLTLSHRTPIKCWSHFMSIFCGFYLHLFFKIVLLYADFIDSAQYLIREKWTCPDRLAINGMLLPMFKWLAKTITYAQYFLSWDFLIDLLFFLSFNFQEFLLEVCWWLQ